MPMVCFLTSSHHVANAGDLNPANGLIAEMRRVFPADCRALLVCDDPFDAAGNDEKASEMRAAFEKEGFAFQAFDVLDGRTERRAPELVQSANLLLLKSGHVPTQNRFFARIGLSELLRGWEGVVLGSSAGSMNSAEVVYAHPELEGEATDPAYQRFLPGLGLTRTMILPHFQWLRYETLDGLRVIEDIACPDSAGRSFLALTDGSYLFIHDGKEEVRGEAYKIEDGIITRLP